MLQAAHPVAVDPGVDLATGPGEVANFYAGRNVLLTGGSGFLGKLLIERLLRSCPNINTLFVLLRAKKGKSPEERFKELFDDMIFDRLKKENPGFDKKLVLIEGDMVKIGLGLSSEQRELLRSTHIVIHSAATVRFDEPIRSATSINVRAARELLLLAKEMFHLKAFIYVSTAYSNCVGEVIEEKFYPPPIDYEKLFSLLDLLDDKYLDHLTPALVGKWPNTYAFTKAVAEDTVRRNSQGLPVAIVRPSIVVATSKEPIAGWTNNVYGPTGVLVGAGIGLLRTMHGDVNSVADLIPADYVVNNIIVAAWDIAKAQSANLNSVDGHADGHADGLIIPEVEDPPIYNVVSSCQRPITWGQLMEYTEEHGVTVPTMMCIWYYCFTVNKYRWIHNLYIIFLHLIPAAIVDSLAWLTGRKPMLWKAYKKIHKFSAVLEYFSMRQWKFSNNNVLQLWERMSLTDRKEFDFDIGSLDWRDFCHRQIVGLRVYLVKDPLDTLPQARVRYARFKVAHYVLVTAACGILVWLLWKCLRQIGLW